MEDASASPVYRYDFTVPPGVIDGNGHVNNVAYVQWMQDAAVRHSESSGGGRAARDAGAIWVVRKHSIEYLRPAYAGDVITAMTWVVHFRRALSLRKYRFVRASDNAELSRGETEWVFLDAASGRPRVIPPAVIAAFSRMPDEQTP